MTTKRRQLAKVALCLFFAGCAQPGEIRTLAEQTRSILATTDSAVPAAENAFEAQRRLVRRQIRGAQDEADYMRQELTEREERWSFTPERKDDLALLQRLRTRVVPSPAPEPATAVAGGASEPASRQSLDRFLKGMAAGAPWTLQDMIELGQSVNEELGKLNKDAAADGAADGPA